jgi:hypothetical protein
MPGTRIVRYSRTVNLTAFVSATKRGIGQDGSHVIRCQSPIERDLCYVLEVLPWVTRYEHQPFTATAAFTDGSHHNYTTDFRVLGTAARLIVECKSEDKVGTPPVLQQVAIGRAWAAENDHQFLLVTGEQLRAGAFLANAKLLGRYAQQPVPAPFLRVLGAILADHPEGLPLAVLAAHVLASVPPPWPEARFTPAPPAAFARMALHALVFRHVLAADLAVPLTDDSRLWIAGQGVKEGADGPLLLR